MNFFEENDPRIVQLNEEIKKFILPVSDQIEMYSHRTGSQEVADKIVKEGFMFSESFQKTTDQIVDDIVYIRYWDTLRKHYGGFIVIIGISKKVFDRVMEKMESKYEVQQALSSIFDPDAEIDAGEEDFTYILPKEYVKGYVERQTGKIVSNPLFNPEYIPENLEKNVEFLNRH